MLPLPEGGTLTTGSVLWSTVNDTSATAGAAAAGSRTGRVDSGIIAAGIIADACMFSAGAKRGCTDLVSPPSEP